MTTSLAVQPLAPLPHTIQAHAASGTQASGLPPGFVAATPQGILMIMQMRMNDLDDQIQGFANGLESNEKVAKAISEDIAALQEFARNAFPGDIDALEWDDDRRAGVVAALEEHGFSVGGRRSTNPDHDLRFKNEEITEQDVNLLIQQRQTELRSANSGNEMTMVNLQSVVQQRSQIISLGTNLLSSFNESTEGIIGNIR